MFIPDLRQFCLALLLFVASFSVSAEIYKWTDDNGQTHYSQTPPADGQAQKVDVPPPPPIDAEQAQQQVDELIERQQEEDKARQEQEQQAQEEAAQQAAVEEKCRILRENLTLYQNNPGRRVVDAEGNVTRMVEEERQQKMQEFQEQIELYCQ